MALQTANQFQLNTDFSRLGTGFQQGQQIANQFQAGQDRKAKLGQAQQATQLSGQALGGNAEALGGLAAIDPARANQIQTYLSSLSEADRTEDMRENNVMTKTALNALTLPEGERRNYLQQQRDVAANDGRSTDRIDGALAGDDASLTQALNFQAREGQTVESLYKAQFPEDAKPVPTQKAEGGMVFNPNTGSYSVDPIAKARLEELALKTQNGVVTLDAKDRQSIGKDITNMIKGTVEIRNTAQDLERLGTIGGGPPAIAMVYKFMKSLDPASVVKEGEFITAEQSSGLPTQVSNFYNKLVKGERLEPGQILEFVNTAQQLANSAIDSSTTEVSKFMDTFEGTIPESFIGKTKERLPVRFNTGKKAPSIEDLVNKYGTN
jgi:hypothetical protein